MGGRMGTKACHSVRLGGVSEGFQRGWKVERAGPLDDELKAADITRGFLSAFDRPPYLHERGNRNRRIEYLEIAAHKRGGLEGARTENAHAAVAQIVKATVKLFRSLGLGTRARTGSQTACVHFEHLRKTLMLTPFTIGEVAHSSTSCPKLPFP